MKILLLCLLLATPVHAADLSPKAVAAAAPPTPETAKPVPESEINPWVAVTVAVVVTSLVTAWAISNR